MKVGIDGRAAKWYRGTGIGTYTYQLLNCLNKIDRKNNYMLFMPESKNCNINFNKNFQIKNIDNLNKDDFWNEVNIGTLLQDNEVQIYHVPQNGVGIPVKKNCHFVITLHDIIPYKMPETVGDTYLKIFLEEMPNIVANCDGIITVSEFSKKDISEAFNYPEEKIYVTYLASEDMYHPINKKLCKDFINKNYSIQDDYILYVGGFSPRKNIVGLIEAFSLFAEDYRHTNNKDIKLVITGKHGKSYSIYKERATELRINDKVIFPGFIPVEHLPLFYNAAELFVYPSFYEGFGLPPIEAMACGIPVIASNVTSIPEILEDCAVLINPSNVEELSIAMQEVINNDLLKSQLIKRGFTKVSELSWEATAKNTIEAYKAIVKI